MKIRKHLLQLGCGILCAAALTGCGAGAPGETAGQTETVPVTETFDGFHLTFVIGNQRSTVPVRRGSGCAMDVDAPAGYRFAGWVNEAGIREDPMDADGDRTYTAVFAPDLTSHRPYLFGDEAGNVHPTDLLTGEELEKALQALAVDPVSLEDITMPEGTVTWDALQALCAQLFPGEAFPAAPEDTGVTRQAFAEVMNGFLGRGSGELLTLESGAMLPPDVFPFTREGLAMLEAVLDHRADGAGVPMEQIPGQLGMGSDFYLWEGRLYHADASGKLLKNGTLGTLMFDEQGRYTSGDPELDAMVAELTAELIRENPDANREQLLEIAFLYCRDSFRYVNRGLLDSGAAGWETEWAKEMLDTGAGNCYSYAAVFWAMARNLGYDAYCYSGYTGKEYDPHGWVQIDFEGEPFIFDTELAMAYLRDGKQYEEMYKMPMWEAEQWPYHWPAND